MKGLFIVSGLGILAMLAEIFKFKKLLYPLVLIGILGAYTANLLEWNNNTIISSFGDMIRFDNVSLVFSGIILATAFFWFILANSYFENETSVTDHFALVLFAITGALMLTAYSNMTTLFLGIEILSIPLYVLAASKKNDMQSNEAGFKYLIMGSLATGFLLFGIALVYGATGSFDLATIKTTIATSNGNLPPFFYAGIVLILIAMCFKVSAAPFHFWAPDVYSGSPIVITAFMSTIVKTAAFAAVLRLFFDCFKATNEVWGVVLAGVIALSLIIANFSAATQTSVKRMLAYSSISHAAFMLMAILANSQNMVSVNAIVYYSLAYSIGSITSFAVLFNVSKNGDESFTSFHGLAKRSPLMAFCMVVAMLSLAGIPVTSGFFAKYFVFTSLISSPYKWLLVLAVLTSAVGVYYYFKVIIAMYFKSNTNTSKLQIELPHAFLLVITTLFTVVLGLAPSYIIEIFN